MTTEQTILEGVEILPEYQEIVGDFLYYEYLGFLALPKDKNPNSGGQSMPVLGFGDPSMQKGENNVPNSWQSITEFRHLPSEMQAVDRQGKGVGARLYNVRQALSATAENPTHFGLYMFEVNIVRIAYAQQRNGEVDRPLSRRVGEHALKLLKGKFLGAEAVVNDVHEKFSDKQGIIYPQTVKGNLLQSKRRAVSGPVLEKFIVIRDPLVLRKFGDVTQR